MYKASKGLSLPIMTGLFEKKNEHQYNLGHNSEFAIPVLYSLYHGTKMVLFLGHKIWNILPESLKKIDGLGTFKTTIKSWDSEKCACRICRIYIHYVGFI